MQASWLYLNRRTVRGDYAFLFYSAAYFALYATLRAFPLASASPSIAAAFIALTYFTTLASVTVGYRLSPWHPLANYPGPVLWRISSVYLTYISFMGRRHLILDKLHAKYGPFLRIGKLQFIYCLVRPGSSAGKGVLKSRIPWSHLPRVHLDLQKYFAAGAS